MFHTKVVGF